MYVMLNLELARVIMQERERAAAFARAGHDARVQRAADAKREHRHNHNR